MTTLPQFLNRLREEPVMLPPYFMANMIESHCGSDGPDVRATLKQLRAKSKMPLAALKAYHEANARFTMAMERASAEREHGGGVAVAEYDPDELRARIRAESAQCDEMVRNSLFTRLAERYRDAPNVTGTAIHEAGHAIMLLVRGVTPVDGFAGLGGKVRHTGDFPQMRAEYAGIVAAGEYAELLFGVGNGELPAPAPGTWTGDTDLEKIRGLGFDSVPYAVQDSTFRCLEVRWPQVAAVALELLDNPGREVSGERLREVFENAPLAEDGEIAPLNLPEAAAALPPAPEPVIEADDDEEFETFDDDE